MPWHVGEQGTGDCAAGEFPVIKDDDGSTAGCHATKEAAEEQLKALYANEESMAAIVAATAEAPVPEGYAKFQSLMVIEGQDTEDTGLDRMVGAGSLRWDVLPFPLKRAPFEGEDSPNHGETQVIGAVTAVRREGSDLIAEGVLSSHPLAMDLAADLAEGMPWSVSIEKADETYEVRFGADGSVRDTTIDALLSGLLVTTAPAQNGTWIKLLVDEATAVLAEPEPVEELALIASSFPPVPPADWFAPVPMDGPTPTRRDGGHVWGHLAGDTCHTSMRGCFKVKQTSRDFKWFNRALLPVAGGSEIPVGPITLWGGHAGKVGPDGKMITAAAAIQHYDETRAAVADVHVYWDEKNQLPAFSGAIRPGVTDEQIRVLVASGVSGDWRPVDDRHSKLIAALCVPSPAFPIPGPTEMPAFEALVASGEPVAMILGPVVAATEPVIKAAGLAVKAADTGRVLLHQRRLDDDHAPGKWEFPGGWLDDGDEDPFEAAHREFEEETGATLPDGKIVHSEVTEDTDYIQFVYLVPEEFKVTGGVDETGSNCCAWMDPDAMNPNTPTSLLRDEAIENDWDAIAAAGEDGESATEEVIAASTRVFALALDGLDYGTQEIRRRNLEDRLAALAGSLGQ